MKFKWTILYVNDVATTIGFYERAFGFRKKFVTADGDYGELETNETTLSFAQIKMIKSMGKDAPPADGKRPSFELAFETDDVKAGLSRAIQAGATLSMPATKQDWGQTISYVIDPNGFLIEICTPVLASSSA